MTDGLRLSVGMHLRATTSGWQYRVQAVDDDRVITSGPHGSLGVDRDELEDDIQCGLVEIEAWP